VGGTGQVGHHTARSLTVVLRAGAGAKVRVVKVDGNQLSGNFSLSFKGQSTGSVIPYNATAAAVKGLLEALPAIPTGSLSVLRSGPDLQQGERDNA
jgi:hypothetical protein